MGIMNEMAKGACGLFAKKVILEQIRKIYKGLSIEEIKQGNFLIPESFLESQLKKNTENNSNIKDISLMCEKNCMKVSVTVTKFLSSVKATIPVHIKTVLFSNEYQGVVLTCGSKEAELQGQNILGYIGIAIAESILLRLFDKHAETALNKGINPNVVWPDIEVDLKENDWIMRIKDMKILNFGVFDAANLLLDRQDEDGIWVKIRKPGNE